MVVSLPGLPASSCNGFSFLLHLILIDLRRADGAAFSSSRPSSALDSATELDSGNVESSPDSGPLRDAEPRFIAECLVVRKLAIEEAFLDFGGFAM